MHLLTHRSAADVHLSLFLLSGIYDFFPHPCTPVRILWAATNGQNRCVQKTLLFYIFTLVSDKASTFCVRPATINTTNQVIEWMVIRTSVVLSFNLACGAWSVSTACTFEALDFSHHNSAKCTTNQMESNQFSQQQICLACKSMTFYLVHLHFTLVATHFIRIELAWIRIKWE